MGNTTVSPAEVARFDALAAGWWDPNGPMRPLHRMNPARIGWIAERVARRFPDPSAVRLLDVGCGAGLAAEALARCGFDVLGLDAAAETIGIMLTRRGRMASGARVSISRVSGSIARRAAKFLTSDAI